MDGGMKLSIQLKLSAAWAAAGATLSLAKIVQSGDLIEIEMFDAKAENPDKSRIAYGNE